MDSRMPFGAAPAIICAQRLDRGRSALARLGLRPRVLGLERAPPRLDCQSGLYGRQHLAPVLAHPDSAAATVHKGHETAMRSPSF